MLPLSIAIVIVVTFQVIIPLRITIELLLVYLLTDGLTVLTVILIKKERKLVTERRHDLYHFRPGHFLCFRLAPHSGLLFEAVLSPVIF